MSGCGVDQGKPVKNEQGGATPTETATATPSPTPSPSPSPSEEPAVELELLGPEKHPVVTIEMSNDEIIKVELYPEVAPNTVNNFISLIDKGYYDGVIFHRVIPGFMIQGGDPQGTGTGGPGYTIKGEFTFNDFTNNLTHTKGVISMARTMVPDSAGSQFFIMTEDSPHLDNQYAAFGKVIEGMETVDVIVNQKRDADDKPLEPLSMKKVTVDKKDMTFEQPETIPVPSSNP
ncbi:peptidylprolyl isomerase [Paenibacillus paeoniae]|uniref:Peptidyl-prolyl cis-trans isomerase n=2 Tax=Paenibacillus paeoniae TaxID=2292705 RepID=A0A371PF25_9BACL|nr:peptidylprolyl isomerase [Paenibacillus paeoniae]